MSAYDLAIIGSGPGGYVAGLYASRHKLRVCVIEKGLTGGTCLNRGCIPTKALLNSVKLVSAVKSAAAYGVEVNGYSVNFATMTARKDEIVQRLRSGIETLFRASSVELIRGTAKFESADTISVDGNRISAKHIIIATGSKVAPLPNIKIDEADVFSSDGILDIRALPKSIAIIGGGVIGCEFANLFNALGVKVSIVELTDRLIPGISREISKKLESTFKKRGIDVRFSMEVKDNPKAEKVLVCVGRRPDTEGMGLAEIGVKLEKGRVLVNEHLQTAVKNIYAIGDCIGAPLLAHKASYDGILAVDNILGASRKADYSNIPNCIWTEPEIASVGLCEEEAKKAYPDAKIAKFPYLASGKAYIDGKTEGFVKIIGDAKGKILGVEIFGECACDLIGEAVLAKTIAVNIKDWAKAVHGHPTLSEIFQEATHIFCGTGIHSI